MWRNTTHSNWKSNVLYPLQNSFSSKPDQAHEEHLGPQVHCWYLSSHIEPKNPILLQISHFSMLCHIATSPSQFPISAPYALIQPTDTLQQLNQSVPRTLEPRPVRGDALLGLVPGHGYCHWTWAAGWHFGLTLVLSHSQRHLPEGLGSWLTVPAVLSLITLLDAVGLGSGGSGLCSADHIFMSLKEQLTFAAPGQVGGFVCRRWKPHLHHPDRMYSECVVLGFHLISGCFLDPSLPSSIMNLSSKLLETTF